MGLNIRLKGLLRAVKMKQFGGRSSVGGSLGGMGHVPPTSPKPDCACCRCFVVVILLVVVSVVVVCSNSVQ